MATSVGLGVIAGGVAGSTAMSMAGALLVVVVYWIGSRAALYAAVRRQGPILWGEGFPVLFAYLLTMPLVGELCLVWRWTMEGPQ